MEGAKRQPREQIPEDVFELFEQAGASEELFELWRELASRMLGADGDVVLLPQAVRSVAMQCIECMTNDIGSSWNSFFLGAAILDAVHARRGVAVGDAPAFCAAVAGLLRKEDDATACVNYEALAQQASQFAQWLRSRGHLNVTADVTLDEIHVRESEILDAVGWVVQLPTIQGWVSAMVNRLHILTRGSYAQAIQTMWQTLVQWMRFAVLRQAASAELMTWEAACGLLGLGLHGARLLPAVAIKGEGSDGAWRTPLFSDRPAQPPLLHTEESDLLLLHLATAADCEVAAVRASCEKVARLMPEFAAEVGRPRPQAVHRTSV